MTIREELTAVREEMKALNDKLAAPGGILVRLAKLEQLAAAVVFVVGAGIVAAIGYVVKRVFS